MRQKLVFWEKKGVCVCVSEIMYEIILLGLYQLNLNAALHLCCYSYSIMCASYCTYDILIQSCWVRLVNEF